MFDFLITKGISKKSYYKVFFIHQSIIFLIQCFLCYLGMIILLDLLLTKSISLSIVIIATFIWWLIQL